MLGLVLKWFSIAFGPPLVHLSLILALLFVDDFILDQSVLASCILAQNKSYIFSRSKVSFGLYSDIVACKKIQTLIIF